MKVLLIGGGGREHALAWKLSQSPRLTKLFAAPGNPGIAEHAELVDLDPADHDAVRVFCACEAIGLVVIGPEAPLVAGLSDALRAAGFAVFGPSRDAAVLEGSKGFTKALCERAGIATARSEWTRDPAALDRFGLPVVIKADGLAAGKGVVVAETRAQAEAALAANDAPAIVEEFLEGEEVSFFALTDGVAIVPFGSAQDHKRVGDGDTGPNTGGMGAYSPASVLTPALEARVMDEIVRPTVRAMAAAGTPYSGILYAGLMLTADGPKLIEYNARFGDPECQVLMMRLESDLLDLLLATAQGRLADADPPLFSDARSLTVVMAGNGYPATPDTGGAIDHIQAAERGGAKVFHAGTALRDGRLVANGGRAVNVTAQGPTVAQARDAAYAAVAAIGFPTGFCRSDIGWRELERERASGQLSAP